MPPSRARDVDEAAPDRPTSSGHGRRPRIVSGRLAGRRRPPTSRSCETVTGPVGGQPARIRAPRRPTAGHHRWMYAMAAGPRRQAASCRLEDSVRHPVTTTRTLDGRKNVTVGGRGGYWFLKPEWLGAPFDINNGAGLDGSVFSPAGDTTALPLSAPFIVRSSFLKDDELPRGRIHPHAGGGPGVFLPRV